MFKTVANYLGLKTPVRRTTLKSVGNSLLIVTVLGGIIIIPTFIIYLEQANQLLEAQEKIEAGFNNVDSLVTKIESHRNNDAEIINQAVERLGMVNVEELPETGNVESSE